MFKKGTWFDKDGKYYPTPAGSTGALWAQAVTSAFVLKNSEIIEWDKLIKELFVATELVGPTYNKPKKDLITTTHSITKAPIVESDYVEVIMELTKRGKSAEYIRGYIDAYKGE